MPSFYFSGKSRNGTRPWTEQYEIDASATITIGDLLIPSSTTGKIIKVAAQTARPEFVANETKTQTATGGETGETLDIMRGSGIWKVGFTPMFSSKTAGSGSTTSIVLSDASLNFSANDWRGGKIYCHNTGETRTITASSTSGSGPYDTTFTVTQPFSQTSTGLVFSATPLGLDVTAAKLIATTFDTITQVIADLTGGYAQILGVDMVNRLLYVVFN